MPLKTVRERSWSNLYRGRNNLSVAQQFRDNLEECSTLPINGMFSLLGADCFFFFFFGQLLECIPLTIPPHAELQSESQEREDQPPLEGFQRVLMVVAGGDMISLLNACFWPVLAFAHNGVSQINWRRNHRRRRLRGGVDC